MKLKTRLFLSIYILIISLIINYANIPDLEIINLRNYVTEYVNIIELKEIYLGTKLYSKIDKVYQNDIAVVNENVIEGYTEYDQGIMIHSTINMIPVIEDGVVVNVNKTSNYGNSITVISKSGLIYYYGFIENIDVKLYQIIYKNESVGVASIDETYNNYTYYLAIKNGKKYLNVVDVIDEN